MSLKKLLKAAKIAIENNDPEDALTHVQEALEYDNENYYAFIFRGKSYQLLNQLEKAKIAFRRATAIEPDTLLGWKGYFQVVKSQDDYEQFFEVLTSYIEVLIDQNVGTAEAVKDLHNYLHAHNLLSNPNLQEYYLRSIMPGTKLGDLIGDVLGKPEDAIQKLINLLKGREQEEVRKMLAKEKLKLPRTLTTAQTAHLYEMEWEIRQHSKLSELYEQFLNICNDDSLRRSYESEYLRYKYALLKVAPLKSELLAEIKEFCSDMVLIGTDELLAWMIYFDLLDPRSLSDLEEDVVLKFIKKFRTEGLGVLLYLFMMSDMCPFNKEKVRKELATSPTHEATPDVEEDDLELSGLQKDESTPDGTLSPSEVLDLMIQGHEKCPKSVLAHRIVCNYYIYLQEYEAGSDKCTQAIRYLAELQRNYGIDLVNCKEDILCSLATVYTYHEAPKNFSRALQLYDRILLESPQNKQAMIGKGLILLEKRQLELADDVLTSVVSLEPEDPRALSELGWCKVLTGEYEKGRSFLTTALNNITGASHKNFESRAANRWRLAKSYLLQDNTGEESVQTAYDLLIESLKDSKNYAPSYTLLGLLYNDYYKDKTRAQKCFYKAFELDVAEITAAKYLVAELALKNEWEITEILCKRVVTSEKSRRILFSQLHEDPDKSWPYRVLGCSALNRQDDAKAIEWFQTALRMKAMDLECWIGLGEAYHNCGRLDAAIKVFRHTHSQDPNSWVAKYMLGVATCEIGDYTEGLSILNQALVLRPNEECIVSAIYEQSIGYSTKLLLGGFIGRTLLINAEAIDYISKGVKINKSSQNLWRALGECIKLVSYVQKDIGNFPAERVAVILEEIDSINDGEISVARALELFEKRDFSEAVSMFGILTARSAIAVLPPKVNKYLRSLTQYNLGLAYLDAFNQGENRVLNYRDQAIVALKAAVLLESGNSQFWLALGNAYVSSNPTIAQHCFIKASVLDNRDGQAWSNLAALYLYYGDAELAQEAFDRATSLTPEQSTSWLGNALTAQARDNSTESSRLFTHAYVLSNGRSPLAQLCYATSIVNKRIGSSKDAREVEAAQEFSIANFAIQSFLKFQPNNEVGLKLALLLSERCHTYRTSIDVGVRLCELLEKRYEETESLVTLADLATAKTLLARVYLGMEDYELAIDNAQFTLDVLTGEDEGEDDGIAEAILSSRIVIGLAFFFNNQFDEALDELRIILSQHSLSQRVVTLIAQVLFAYDSPDTKQAALDQLFAHIEEHGLSLIVVLTLGAISVVDNLEDYFAPIKEELEGLPLDQLIGDSFRMVPKLLAELGERLSGKKGKVWQKFAMLFPSDFNVWKNLDSRMALSSALLTDSKRTAVEVSDAYLQRGSRREVQRALLLCVGNEKARACLGVSTLS